jgi:3-oxoacyl-[acyl-carrier protein] reductase
LSLRLGDGARRRKKLEETAQSIADKGGKAICVDLDVTDSASVRNCFAEAESSVGIADILVNNAGISREGFLADLSEEDWDAE